MKALIAAATLLCARAGAQNQGSTAEEPKLPPPTCNVRYELLAIQMAQHLGLAMIPRLRDHSRTGEAVAGI